MKNNILTTLGGIALGSALTFGAVSSPAPELTDQQLYILTEIVNDRIPQVNVRYSDINSFSVDYVKIARIYKDNFTGAINECAKNKGDDACNLYKRIQNRIALIK